MKELIKFSELINSALSRNETVILGSYCKIEYSGRAESFLDFGDRVIMIKSDNALIVHQPKGNAPVNYMKPDSNISSKIDDCHLVISSSNLALKEFLDISVKKVHFFNSFKLEDGHSIVISGTEKDMSDMIYKNPSLIEDGFKAASREEQTKYGFIDVLGVDKNNILSVIECKRYCADLGAVTQLRRYVEKLRKSKGISEVRGIIAAPKITPNALKMLTDWGFDFKQVDPPKHLERFRKGQKKLDCF